MRLGIDLGGTKIEGALIDVDGRIARRERVATPRDSFERTIEQITGVVRRLEAHADRECSLGVCHPGSVSPTTGLHRNANSTALNGCDLRGSLESALGREVRTANDANCFALSEAVDGAAAGASVVFGVILGTGVGGGIVIDGRVLEGCNAVAGEWGHIPMPGIGDDEMPKHQCSCGQQGCLELFLSGTGIERLWGLDGHAPLTAEQIAQRSQEGDARAIVAMERHAAMTARALGVIVNTLDPDCVVLGGGVSNARGLAGRVSAQLARHTFGDVHRTRVVHAMHGDSSGVRGAAWLWGGPGG